MKTYEANIINKTLRILHDKEISDLIKAYKGVLNDSGRFSIKLEEEVKSKIRLLLKSKNIPISWIEPIYNSIWLPSVDTPLGDGIHIEIDNDIPTEQTKIVYENSEIYENYSDVSTFKIVISKKVSKEDLINFIEENEFILDKIQTNLNLPVDPALRSLKTLYALAVIKMRDEKKMSFEDISTFIVDDINNSTTLKEEDKKAGLKMCNSGSNVRKNLYDKFKDDYFFLKNSS